MKRICYFLLTLAVCSLYACNPSDKEIMGWVPVYASVEDMAVENLTTLPPIENAGKIYIKGEYFYQVENGKGIHVIDITDKEAPMQVAFIQVAGAQDISIRGTDLYVNSFNDLVLIDISNIHQVKETHREKNTFHLFNSTQPPQTGYFECVDTSKGTVISWQQRMISNPKCRI